MAEKRYGDMNDDELREAHATWEGHVAAATGWASAYMAACQVKAIVRESDRRGLGLINNYPIKVG